VQLCRRKVRRGVVLYSIARGAFAQRLPRQYGDFSAITSLMHTHTRRYNTAYQCTCESARRSPTSSAVFSRALLLTTAMRRHTAFL